MSMKLLDIVLMGLETTRGTAAGSLPFHCPFVMPGFVPAKTPHKAEIVASSTFPEVTENVPLGVTTDFTFSPDVNVGTIRDLLLWATKWASNSRPALTIARTRAGIGQERYMGCVVTRLEMGYSRGATPSEDSVLSINITGTCMQRESTTGLSAGPQSVTRHFTMQNGVYTIDSVAAAEVLSLRRTIELMHAGGPPNASGKRIYSEDGVIRNSVEITSRFSTAAISTLADGQTQHVCSFVHGTGTANETVTETLGKCIIDEHTEAEQDGMMTMTNRWSTSHTGAAASLVLAFGGAIGASQLGL